MFSGSILTSSGGKGAVYSGVSILIYQGFFTLCALGLGGSIDQIVADSIAGIGGVLLVGVGINLLGLKQIPVGNYILSLFIPLFITFLKVLVAPITPSNNLAILSDSCSNVPFMNFGSWILKHLFLKSISIGT